MDTGFWGLPINGVMQNFSYFYYRILRRSRRALWIVIIFTDINEQAACFAVIIESVVLDEDGIETQVVTIQIDPGQCCCYISYFPGSDHCRR